MQGYILIATFISTKVLTALFASFVSYKSFGLYKKTKKIIPYFLALSFLVITIAYSLELVYFKSEKLTYILEKTTEIKKTIPSPTNKSKTIEVLGMLALLFIMFAFYKKTTQQKTVKRKAPKILIYLATALLILYSLYSALNYMLSLPDLLEIVFLSISLATHLILPIGLIYLGVLAYKASNKNHAYFYLNEAFILLALGIQLIVYAIALPLSFLAIIKAPMLIITVSTTIIIFSLTCYAYYLVLKAIKIFEKNPSEI